MQQPTLSHTQGFSNCHGFFCAHSLDSASIKSHELTCGIAQLFCLSHAVGSGNISLKPSCYTVRDTAESFALGQGFSVCAGSHHLQIQTTQNNIKFAFEMLKVTFYSYGQSVVRTTYLHNLLSFSYRNKLLATLFLSHTVQ